MSGNRDRWHRLEACLAMAKVYLAMGQSGKADNYLKEGLTTAREIKSWEHLAEAYRLKAELEEKAGNYKAALENQRHYAAYTDSVTNEKDINRLNNLRVNYITEKGNKEKELISRAYADEQQQKKYILYWFVMVVVVSPRPFSRSSMR